MFACCYIDRALESARTCTSKCNRIVAHFDGTRLAVVVVVWYLCAADPASSISAPVPAPHAHYSLHLASSTGNGPSSSPVRRSSAAAMEGHWWTGEINSTAVGLLGTGPAAAPAWKYVKRIISYLCWAITKNFHYWQLCLGSLLLYGLCGSS